MMKLRIKRNVLFIVFFGLISGKSVAQTKADFKIDKGCLQNVEDYGNYSISYFVDCGCNSAALKKSFALFDGFNLNLQNQNLKNLSFSGWNHAVNGQNLEWANLKLGYSNYNFSTTAEVDSDCDSVRVIDVVLLKKIADWNRQHVNGFECNVLSKGYKFGDIENLVFDIKINSKKTSIPDLETLKNTYANYVDKSVIDALDDGKVNIGITLGDVSNLNGSIVFQLDQVVLKDRWVRVIVPMNKLRFYQEINYKRTTKTFADLSNVVINRMLIVGETKKGSVLRGNIGVWNNDIPETFKEMGVSFKKIEFQLK